jgi:hypothetical protein
MVWGAMGFNYKPDLVRVELRMDSAAYCEMLRGGLLPYFDPKEKTFV